MVIRRLAVVMGVLAGCLISQAISAQTTGPRIKTAQETCEFGIVPQNAHVSHVFWLHNTGDQELHIDKLIPNCGCTQAPLDKQDVAPGDSARVELIFSSSTFDGPVEKFTQIVSNSTGRAPVLVFHANVLPDSMPMMPIEFTPRAISLDDMRPDKTDDGYSFLVTLKNMTGEPIGVKAVDLPDRWASVRPFDVKIAARGDYSFFVTFDDGLAAAEFYSSMTITTSDEEQTRVSLPIFKTKRWNSTDGS